MILSRGRIFSRQEPNRDAKSIYIFCEGKDREYKYFNYFKEIDSRLNLVVYELKGEEDNSPKGLYLLAQQSLVISEENPNPKYELIEGDEVWIVLDTDKDINDSRKPQIKVLREDCITQNWQVAQSNPCFEVWLYYHQEVEKPNFEGIEISAKWKTFVGEVVKGGFNPRKHPILIQQAITNAEINFIKNEDGWPDIASTEVFRLGQAILAIGGIRQKIIEELANMNKIEDL
jgi:hypothetical protein